MMKKIFGTFILAFVLTVQFVSAQVISGPAFEGKIIMTIEYEEVPEEIEPYVGMLPKETVMYIKKDKSRMEQNVMGGTSVTVMDRSTGKGFMMTDVMGNKSAYELKTDDIKDEGLKSSDSTQPVITYSDETKEIAGYKCKKATIKYEGEDETVDVWYTEEITGGYNSKIKGIPGQLMEYTVRNNDMVMVFTVSSVSKEKVDDSIFEVPAGVELKSYEEMMKMGMMMGDGK